MASPAAGGAAADDRSAPFLAEDDDLDDFSEEEDEDTDEDEEEESKPLPLEISPARVSIPPDSPPNLSIPIPSSNGVTVNCAAENGEFQDPDRKRQKTDIEPDIGTVIGRELIVLEKKPQAITEDSRRLFQRLFTDEDEITILQGFLDFTSQRTTAAHHDTGPFYEQIKSRLQLDFNKNQLVEKLRRLKKKYRNIRSKKDYAFKSPHEQATFEISRRIWGSGDEEDDSPPPRPIRDENCSPPHVDREKRRRARRKGRGGDTPLLMSAAEGNVPPPPLAMEDTARNFLSPLFRELLYGAAGGQFGVSAPPAMLPRSAAMEEKWRKQQILELEVYSKRIELVQDQIKMILEELRK